MQVSSFDEWAKSAQCPAPWSPAAGPLSVPAAWECLPRDGGSSGFSPFLWPPRVRVRRLPLSFISLTHSEISATRHTGDRPGVTSREGFMTFSVK